MKTRRSNLLPTNKERKSNPFTNVCLRSSASPLSSPTRAITQGPLRSPLRVHALRSIRWII